MTTVFNDVRYSIRMLAKNPGFTAVAVITLALGIAVNTSIFSLISGWLLKKPAMTDPDRVVAVVSANPALAIDRGRVSAADFSDWRREARVFEDLAAVEPLRDFNLSGERSPERVPGMRVTANYFRVLGVPPLLGRTFLEGEDEPGRDRVLAPQCDRPRGGVGSKSAGA